MIDKFEELEKKMKRVMVEYNNIRINEMSRISRKTGRKPVVPTELQALFAEYEKLKEQS